MTTLELVLLMLGTSLAAAFVLAILVCTVGGPAIYLREFVRSIYRQIPHSDPHAQRLS